VLAKSFARIHLANLINFGILPLVFENPADYDSIDEMDELSIENLMDLKGNDHLTVKNLTKGLEYAAKAMIDEKDVPVLHAGGTLNHIKNMQNA
ncbi:MAG: aconitate hydratase, partial [Erysipelotrichaceae bacterium]|nr:aconitate hydratase [Erysipelotrichaceae bacterium]